VNAARSPAYRFGAVVLTIQGSRLSLGQPFRKIDGG
jgi:hypothetical protein